MQKNNRQWLSIVLPSCLFAIVFAIHYIWQGVFPEEDPLQSQWLSLPKEISWFRGYIDSQAYWLGYSYGLSAAFAAVAFRNYLKSSCRTSKTFAIGGVTFSGFLAFTGCFLIGCCGSPMFVVWINIFGAAFIPFAKPFIAFLTTLTIGGAWWWMVRRKTTLHNKIDLQTVIRNK